MASQPIATDFNALSDKVKFLLQISDTTTRQLTAAELLGQIASAQSERNQLIEQINGLKNEIKRFETWEAEKARYQLEQLPPGVHVMTLKPGMENGEPAHYVCKTCYQNGKKSVLDSDEPGNGIHHLSCRECDTKLQVGHFRVPRVNYGPRRNDPHGWMEN